MGRLLLFTGVKFERPSEKRGRNKKRPRGPKAKVLAFPPVRCADATEGEGVGAGGKPA